MYVIVHGSPLIGLEIVGPFNSKWDAEHYARHSHDGTIDRRNHWVQRLDKSGDAMDYKAPLAA